jgi:BNR/Asp-box repeat
LTALVFGSGNSIWFSRSLDNGRTFSTPTKVAEVPILALGRHRGPRIVLTGNSIIVSAVYGKAPAMGPHAHGLPEDGDLMAWRSTDKGQTWSQPVIVNDIAGAAREGLHAMAADEHGQVAAVWLDLRMKGTRLYGAYSQDAGKTWSKNILVYESPSGTICQCCHPSLVSSGGNTYAVMFRDAVGGNRDMYLSEWHINGAVSVPRKLGEGSWALNACPMDGGGLARKGDEIITVWRRDHTVFLDTPGKPERAMGEGKDVTIAASSQGAYIAWTSSNGVQLQEPGRETPVVLTSTGSFPSLVGLPGSSVLAAWEQDGKIVTRVEEGLN